MTRQSMARLARTSLVSIVIVALVSGAVVVAAFVDPVRPGLPGIEHVQKRAVALRLYAGIGTQDLLDEAKRLLAQVERELRQD